MSDNPNVSQSDLQQAFESYHQIILPYLGGGGSGGSTYTLLFEGTAPTNLNTNNLTSSSASVELSDSIEHYEFIEIFFQSQEPFNGEGAIFAHGIMPVSAIIPLYTTCTFETSEGFVVNSATYFSRQSWGFYDSTHISRCWESYSGWTHNANHLIVYGIKNGNVGNNSHRYSEEEQVVGTWIDGRPIYEKTLVQALTNNDGQKEAVYQLSLPQGIEIVHYYCIFVSSGNNVMSPRVFDIYTIQVTGITPEGSMSVYTGKDYTAFTAYVTVQYIKTSDTPSV